MHRSHKRWITARWLTYPLNDASAIIELLADGAGSMPLGEIAERLSCRRAARTGCSRRWWIWAGRRQDPDTSFYRLTMRLAILGQRFYVATGIPDICQPLLDRLAHAMPRVRAARGRRRPFAGLGGACAGRHRRPAVSAFAHHQHGAALRDRERQGVARDAADRTRRSRTCVKNGGFERRRQVRPERDPVHRGAAARAQGHGATRLRLGD